LHSEAARIRIWGDRCLRRRAAAVDPADPAVGAVLDAMWGHLRNDGGVGLAAPQLGHAQRLVVIRDPQQPAGRQRLDLINPEIVETFGPDEPFEEGCLSFPGLFVTVRRPRGVEVRYRSATGDTHTLRDDGLVARIVLHEVDHLEGVLFIDHLSAWRGLTAWPRLTWLRLRHWTPRGRDQR